MRKITAPRSLYFCFFSHFLCRVLYHNTLVPLENLPLRKEVLLLALDENMYAGSLALLEIRRDR